MAPLTTNLSRVSLRKLGIRFAAAGLIAIVFLAAMAGAGHVLPIAAVVALLPGMLLALLILPILDFTEIPRWFLSDEFFEGPGFYALLSGILAVAFWWSVAFACLSRHARQKGGS